MLDHTSFPDIFDTIVDNLDWKGLCALRTASRAMNNRVQSILYRHVVIAPHPQAVHQVVILDPYSHKVILNLERSRSTAWAKQRRIAKQPKSVRFEKGLARLVKHARVVQCKGMDLEHGQDWAELFRSVVDHTDVSRVTERELDLSVFFTGRKAEGWQRSLFLHIDPTLSGAEGYSLAYVDTLNLLKEQDEFVILVSQSDKSYGKECYPWHWWRSTNWHLLPDLTCYVQNAEVLYSKMTFVKLNAFGQDSSSSDWDLFLQQHANEWEEFRSVWSTESHPLPEITFSHKSLKEFQLSSGMSDQDLQLFTTPPGTKLPSGPAWAR